MAMSDAVETALAWYTHARERGAEPGDAYLIALYQALHGLDVEPDDPLAPDLLRIIEALGPVLVQDILDCTRD